MPVVCLGMWCSLERGRGSSLKVLRWGDRLSHGTFLTVKTLKELIHDVDHGGLLPGLLKTRC